MMEESKNIGLEDGKLKACPADRHNCVGSMYPQDNSYVAPWPYANERAEIRKLVEQIIEDESNAWIESKTDDYIHAVFKIPIMGFKDDVEFYFPKDEKLIHFRSASRVGGWDLGVNRRRIGKLRAKLAYRLKSELR